MPKRVGVKPQSVEPGADTGLKDVDGEPIRAGDQVSLAGIITADNSLGALPNGWWFEDDDVYEVYWDERIPNWSLAMGVEPDSAYNVKYLNHALTSLHNGNARLVRDEPPKDA